MPRSLLTSDGVAIAIYCLCYYAITARESPEDLGRRGGFFKFDLWNRCDCRCGWPNRRDRILGGETTKQYEFPWSAHIRAGENRIIPATLINDRYVITSASLLARSTPYDLKILLGLQDRCNSDVSSTIFSVSSVKIHELYSSLTGAHDVALVKLNGRAPFDRRTSPICLPLPDRSFLGEVATLAGWTKIDGNDSLNNCRPLKLGLPILGRRQCPRTVLDPTFFTEDKGCVGVVGGASPICKGDGGGAVMFRDKQGIYEIIGILSDKNSCGPPPSTAMYTEISRHMSWIKANTIDACYCLKI